MVIADAAASDDDAAVRLVAAPHAVPEARGVVVPEARGVVPPRCGRRAHACLVRGEAEWQVAAIM